VRDYVYIDDHDNAMTELANERDTWKEIAEALYLALECEKGLRRAGITDDTECPVCFPVVDKYWKAVHDAE
jgi:hypothetical protein